MKQELYINNQLVELSKEIGVALNLAITDISQPQNVKGDYSKTIKLPASKKIHDLLNNIFDTRIDLAESSATFNPNNKVECVYRINSVEQIDGFFRLKKINIEDGCITYDCEIIGRNATFFTELGDSEVQDLDVSEFNHNWTMQNQEDSWATQIQVNGSPQPFALGTGYVYPHIDYGFDNTEDAFNVEHFFPALYERQILDKIFASVGYTFTSPFLDSDEYKGVIVPYGGTELRLSTQQVTDRFVNANTATTNTISLNSTAVPTVVKQDFTNVVQDNLSQFDLATDFITIDQSGYYDFIGEINVNAVFTPNTVNSVVPDVVLNLAVYVRNVSTGVTVAFKGGNIQTDGNPFTTSYTTAINPTPVSPEYYVGVYPSTSTPNTQNPASAYICNRTDFYASAGEQYEVIVRGKLDRIIGSTDLTAGGSSFLFQDAATPGTYYTGTIDLNVNAADVRMIAKSTNIVEGNVIDMNQTLPRDTKQIDFVKDIINTYNLFVQPDRDNPKNLIIEPRDDFYNDEVEDWTQKLDEDSELVLEPLGGLGVREIEFKTKEDKDYFNEIYQDTYDETYGYRSYLFPNDFLTGKKTIQVGYAATPLVDDVSHDRIYSEIYKVDNNGQRVQTESKRRRLYYGGLKNTNQAWAHESNLTTTVYRTSYAYAGHLDDPYNPTFDLNFGIPKEVYYAQAGYQAVNGTLNGIVNKYWYNYINEISNVNSKLVTGYFRLLPQDIANLSFRKLYYFNGDFFRLQKVVDYSGRGSDLTKCQFIKFAEIIDFSNVNFVINGGVSSLPGGLDTEFTPVTRSTTFNGNSVQRHRNVIINGKNNYVDPAAKNVRIDGDNNKVFGAVNNVVIAGNGIEVTESNKVFGELANSLYNGSGELVENTTVDGKTFDLTFDDLGNFEVSNSGSVVFNDTNNIDFKIQRNATNLFTFDASSAFNASLLIGNSLAVTNFKAQQGRGVLFPRVDSVNEGNITTPETGLQLVNTDKNRPRYYDGNDFRSFVLDFDSIFKEFTYTTGQLTKVETYTDNTKAVKLETKDLTYTAGVLTQSVFTDELSGNTETKSFVYDGSGNLINITKS